MRSCRSLAQPSYAESRAGKSARRQAEGDGGVALERRAFAQVAYRPKRTSSERAESGLHLNADDRSSVCATTSPRTDRLRRYCTAVAPFGSDNGPGIEDHHENDSQR